MVEGKHRKTLVGEIVSDKMEKTVVVAVQHLKRHTLYRRGVRVTKRYKAHDPEGQGKIGDVVQIQEARPMSREKRWRIVNILRRKEMPTIAPEAISAEEGETAES